ncbi:unnamed protein product [Peronospora destructor]|uniref:Uncharacterized protein n=1 Tax=Peronospora destructor TaxID=86335 RepID=A0AAV0U8T3_9STRA|nr:unnamed protein product [Peronospora destructor]
MEIVVLNMRLREAFSALLKQLPCPRALSIMSNISPSVLYTPSSSPGAYRDLYTQHCHFMLTRLNSYHYDSANAFLLDLEQLECVAESLAMKQKVKNLFDCLTVSESEKQGEERFVKVSNQCGTTVSLGSSFDVPGLQEVTSIGSEAEETETNTMWLCNLTMNHEIVTIGTFRTKEEALQGYEEQRKLMVEDIAEFNKLKLFAAKREEKQREEDLRVLKEAVAQCHPRLTTMKMAPVTAPTSGPPVINMTSMTRETPQFVARSIAADAAVSSPKVNSAPSETEVSSRRVARSLKRQRAENISSATSSTKKQKVGSAIASSSSVGGRSYLRLRRLIQKRLCRHLKGREVCVLSNPDKLDGRLRASGRLEAGKVFSFRRKKQMTFADYVCDELGRAESACAHMILVRSKESIDDHLKVCDAFLDRKRELACTQHAKSKKASR